jgi:thioredoxin-like negative regulator of GroEL
MCEKEEKADKMFHSGNYKDAIPLFEDFLQEDENPLVRMNLGRCYIEMQ